MKAFDRVPHERLISKLNSYNIDTYLINWIKSFVSWTQLYVKLNGFQSKCSNVFSGILQRSMLGPLLFIIYINELPDLCISPAFLYANDAKYYKHIVTEQDQIILTSEKLGYFCSICFQSFNQNWKLEVAVQLPCSKQFELTSWVTQMYNNE